MSGAVRFCIVTLLVLLPDAVRAQAQAQAQAPDDSSDNATLLFRRVFVLKEQIAEMAAGYLPIKREEFERRLKAARQHGEHRRDARTLIRQAEYTARFDAVQWVEGTARLQIEHDGEEPGLLSLSPCDLPIRDAAWFEQDKSRPAKVGTNPQGQTIVIVEKSGELRFQWTLRGNGAAPHDQTFDLRFPPAAVNQLLLKTPPKWQLAANKGLLRAEPKSNANGSLKKKAAVAGKAPTADDATPADQNELAWHLELGGETSFSLQATLQTDQDRTVPQVIVRKRLHYDIAPTGVSLRADLRLDARDAGPQTLIVETSPGLTITQASLGEKKLKWNGLASETDGRSRWELPLAEPLTGINRLLRIHATAQTVAGAALPTLRLVNGEWQECEATLFIQEPLQLLSLDLKDARQTHQSHVSTPVAGRSVQVQFHARGAELRPRWVRLGSDPRVAQGTSITVDTTSLTARAILELTAARGAIFELEAAIAAEWLVDEVTTIPPEALDDYEVTSGDNLTQQLRIALRQPVTGKQGARIVIRGHRRRPPESSLLSIAQLRFCEPLDVSFRTRLMTLATDADSRIELTNDRLLPLVEPAKLSAADGKLIEPRTGSLTWLDDERARATRFRIRAEAAQFSTDVSIVAKVTSANVKETYAIDVIPEAAPVGKTLVHFSVPRETSLRWRIEDLETASVSARRLTADQMKAAALADGEVWEVQLDPPLAIPFRLAAERSFSWTNDADVSLVAFPEADSQTAGVTVIGDGTRPRVSGERAVPIPPESPSPDYFQQVLAAFRYEPGEAAKVHVQRSVSQAQKDVWSWSASYSAFVHPGTTTVYKASLKLENSGATSLAFQLPVNGTLEHCSINDQPLAQRIAHDSAANRYVVPLPPDVRFPRIEIRYTAPTPNFVLSNKFSAQLPHWDFPVIRETGTLWLPPGVSAVSEEVESAERGIAASCRRILGPLLREQPHDTTRLKSATLNLEQSDSAAQSSLVRAGWTATTLPRNASQPLTLRRDGTVWGLASALALVFAGLLAWSLRRGDFRWSCFVVVAAFVTLLLSPTLLVPIVRAACWGCVLGAAIHWTRRIPLPVREPDGMASTITRMALGGARILSIPIAVVIGIATLHGLAAEKLPVVYRVVEVVDEQQKLADEYVYLPQDFYKALTRRSSLDRQSSQGWLLSSAEYSGSLRLQAGDERFELMELVANFELEVTQPGIRVLLPFAREQVNLAAERATLNGQAVTLEWDEAGRGLALVADAAGPCSLEVVLHPIAKTHGTVRGFDLKIPRASQAECRLQIPSSAAQVRLPGARGAVTTDDVANTLHAELGPVDTLALQWRAGAVGDREFDATADELVWLEVRSGAVSLETQMTFMPSDGVPLKTASMTIDSRWNLLPWEDDRAMIAETVEGYVRRIRFDFPEGVTQPITLRPSFLLARASGIGSFRMPRLETQRTRVARRWGAVTVATGLDMEVSGTPPTDAVNADEFLAAWEGERSEPKFVFRLRGDDAPPLVMTRPRSATASASCQMDLVADSDLVELHLSYLVSAPSGSLFTHRLSMPANFEPTAISVTLDGEERLDRWLRDGDGTLTLFLDGPIQEGHKVRVAGKIPLTAKAANSPPSTVALPKLLVNEESETLVTVWRRPSVQVELVADPTWSTISPATLNAELASAARPIATLQPSDLDQRPDQIPLRVTTNRPRVSGGLATICRRRDQWEAELDCRLQVEAGVLDELRLEVPVEWSGPFSSEPADVSCQLINIPGQTRRWLVARPATAFAGETRLRIRGAIATVGGELERAPRIVPLDLPRVERLLLMPSLVRNQKVEWETSFIQRLTLNTDAPWAEFATPDWIAYRQLSARSRVVSRRVETPPGTPRVRLADFTLNQVAPESLAGIATFDIEPAGALFAELEIPASVGVVHVFVEGVSPVIARDESQTTWRVPLVSSRLSQRMEVLFTCDTHEGSGREASLLALPRIAKWLVARTLVSYVGTPGAAVQNEGSLPGDGGLTATEEMLRQWRDHSASLALKQAEEVAAGERLSNDIAWREAWQARISSPDRGPDGELATSLVSNLLHSDAPKSAEVRRGNFAGEMWNMSLPRGDRPASEIWLRIGAALALGAFAMLLLWSPARELAMEFALVAAPAALVVIGFAWWIWCVLPWCSAVFVLLGFATAQRRDRFAT